MLAEPDLRMHDQHGVSQSSSGGVVLVHAAMLSACATKQPYIAEVGVTVHVAIMSVLQWRHRCLLVQSRFLYARLLPRTVST